MHNLSDFDHEIQAHIPNVSDALCRCCYKKYILDAIKCIPNAIKYI